MQRRKKVKNNNRSNYQKQLCTRSTLFVHFFAVVWHDYNVKLLWRKCHTCSRSLFFTAAHLHLALVAASISHLTTATKVSCCSSNKKCLLCFLSLALNPCRPFSRWACRPLSLFLCLSLALYSKFVDMTIYLSLILWSLLTLLLSLLYKMPVAMWFPAKITSSCIWVTIPVDWVILHWYTCGADGRSLGRAGGRAVYGHVITNFSRMGSILYFLTHVAPLARFAQELRYETTLLQLIFRAPWLCKSFWLWFDRTFLLAS